MASTTKTELIANVAKRVGGVSRAATKKMVDALLDEIFDTVRSGARLPIEGFGTFEVVERGARTGRNPRTGEEIQIDKRMKVKFTPGKYLKLATTDESPAGDVFTQMDNGDDS